MSAESVSLKMTGEEMVALGLQMMMEELKR